MAHDEVPLLRRQYAWRRLGEPERYLRIFAPPHRRRGRVAQRDHDDDRQAQLFAYWDYWWRPAAGPAAARAGTDSLSRIRHAARFVRLLQGLPRLSQRPRR